MRAKLVSLPVTSSNVFSGSLLGSLQSSQNTGMLETTTRIFIPHERNNSTQDFTTAHARLVTTLELRHSGIIPRSLPRYPRNLAVTV